MTEEEVRAQLVLIASVLQRLVAEVGDLRVSLDTIDLRTERTLELAARLAGDEEGGD